MKNLLRYTGLTLTAVLCMLSAKAQEPQNSALYQTVSKLDSAMFAAYNRRDLQTFMAFFSPDLEFYDDRSGLTGYDHNYAAFRRNFTDTEHSSRRELVKGSLEVYRLGNFGALAIGVHRFYGTVNGVETLEATAKFTEVWENRDGRWQVKREMSYDHR
ncbi:MAG TPA: nuclear transport factor 2 family protein [Mucilaginibacter sp.]|nr:nuclear transport factor 2 family protein [Mucilaginibacter sp.]